VILGLLAFGMEPKLSKDEMFNRWIGEYPREYRVARGSARREFMKLPMSREVFANMLEILAIQKRSARWEAGWVPTPANYLRDERMFDPAEAYPPAKTSAPRDVLTCNCSPSCYSIHMHMIKMDRERREAGEKL
jgi:hypothetical protein